MDMHYELELGVVLEGSMLRFRRREQAVLRPGDLWLCGTWDPHGFELQRVPCRLLVIVIWPPLLANLSFPEAPDVHWLAPFTKATGGFLHPAASPRKTVLAMAEDLATIAANDASGRIVRRLKLLDLLLFLDRSGLAPLHAEGGRPHDVYSQITPAIELAFASRTRIPNVTAARACGMSTFAFVRRFESWMQLSFSQFALRHRLSQAAQEIASTDWPIKAVACNWGFTDESHLHRLFVHHYHVTPAQYRAASPGRGRDGDCPTAIPGPE
ncbi:MAG: helix-turn-helix transcriptional regulator [Kiritimatiellae bacterium]|nr:helix-turn-helix transcriptional regulator [Kiritimatiellia bacterium]